CARLLISTVVVDYW
nr:immunoglobulin heavy chain junction region [Mus musculus]